MTEDTHTNPLAVAELPPVGQPFAGGTFAGVATIDGVHVAVVLQPDRLTGNGIGWKRAIAWAKTVRGELPSPQIAALLHHAQLSGIPRLCWTATTLDSTRALMADMISGEVHTLGPMADGSAIAVRLLPLAGNAAADDLERRVAAVEGRVVAESLARRVAALEALLPAAA